MALALTNSIPRSRPKNIATYPKDHRINGHFASRKTRRAQIRNATGYPHPAGKFILMLRMYWRKESDPSRGYHPVCTSDGIGALDLARKRRPDLILMDIQLPEVSGLEVTNLAQGRP